MGCRFECFEDLRRIRSVNAIALREDGGRHGHSDRSSRWPGAKLHAYVPRHPVAGGVELKNSLPRIHEVFRKRTPECGKPPHPPGKIGSRSASSLLDRTPPTI